MVTLIQFVLWVSRPFLSGVCDVYMHVHVCLPVYGYTYVLINACRGPAVDAGNPLLLPSDAEIIGGLLCPPGVSVHSGDTNADFLPCVAVTLTTAPCPQPFWDTSSAL